MMERRIINSIKELKGLSKIEVDEYLIGNVVTLKEEDFNYLRDRGIILPSIFEEQYKALDDESKAYVEDLLVYYYKKIYTYVKSHESNIEYIYYDMYSFQYFNYGVTTVYIPKNIHALINRNNKLKEIYEKYYVLLKDNSSKISIRGLTNRCDYCFENIVNIINHKYLDILGTLTVYEKNGYKNGRNGIFDVSKDFDVKF